MSRRLRLIVNPSSGGGRALAALPQAEAAIVRLGFAYAVHRTTSLDHGRELAVAGAQAGEIVVTLSGDGLVGAVAGALVPLDGALLGVLPGGRGNDFARALGIPVRDIDAACAVLRDGRPRAVDVGVVGDRPFVGVASFGFDSDANRIANAAPAWLGQGVYAYGLLRALAAWAPATFTLRLDDEPERRFRGYSVAVANARGYGGGMLIAPAARLDDGLFDVVVVKECSRLRLVSQVPKLFRGTHVANPEIEVLRAHRVGVDADRPFTVYADGDPLADLPQTISMRPAALNVLAPAA